MKKSPLNEVDMKLWSLMWSWSRFSTKFGIVTMISSWFLRDFSVIFPGFFGDLWSESLSWHDHDVIFHQFYTTSHKEAIYKASLGSPPMLTTKDQNHSVVDGINVKQDKVTNKSIKRSIFPLIFLTITWGIVKHYCTYSLTFTEVQITKYYTRVTGTHMP